MRLRSDKRELRTRNQPKTTNFLKNHRKKRKRPRNQYSKTIKLMKNEKQASVLSTTQYSADDITLYNDKSLKAKIVKPSYIDFSSDSDQFGTISYDLNAIDIRSSSIAAESESLDYASSSERFQKLDAHQYDFDCNYSKGTTDIQTVADMILKSK
jgi:hypothetical protein